MYFATCEDYSESNASHTFMYNSDWFHNCKDLTEDEINHIQYIISWFFIIIIIIIYYHARYTWNYKLEDFSKDSLSLLVDWFGAAEIL
jgi:hypothetical protein